MNRANHVFGRRRAGLLLHITSLPGGVGHGDLGESAYRFVDVLAELGVTVWQVLPLTPTFSDGSPYCGLSAHAGNNLLIDPAWLYQHGWLPRLEPQLWDSPWQFRYDCLRQAYVGFVQDEHNPLHAEFATFCAQHDSWLDDYALFMALRKALRRIRWQDWPAPLRDRQAAAIAEARRQYANRIARAKFEQFVFFLQWQELRRYANSRGVLMYGDVPIFVCDNSADVWANRDQFQLDPYGYPATVAGVPPDYFSATGQRWGNPHYHWENMAAEGFRWWLDRMRTQQELFDVVRIDHFRGFEAYWEIPASESTAMNGRWVKAPGAALLEAFHGAFYGLPLVAENLGIITPEVEALRQRFDIPGMLILQFAFDGGPTNPYLPHQHDTGQVVYTGTHDNDTTLSWYLELPQHTQRYLQDYLGHPAEAMPWPLVRAALASPARLAVVPMQDVLGLGSGHRMNTPGTTVGNWRWRMAWDQVTDEAKARFTHWVHMYGRA